MSELLEHATYDESEVVKFPPLWWLKHKWMDAGSRRDRLKNYFQIAYASRREWDPLEHYRRHHGGGGYTPISGFSRITPSNNTVITPARAVPRIVEAASSVTDYTTGNLPWNDYAFFSGAQRPTDGFSVCRFCLMGMYAGESSRNWHRTKGLKEEFAVESCMRRLQLAYKKVLMAHKCVVCGVFTLKHNWGVPICCASCVKCWMFSPCTFKGPIADALGYTVMERQAMRRGLTI